MLLGRFNPSIFQPEWFRHKGLLAESLARSAEPRVQEMGSLKIQFISPQVASFSTSSFTLQVTQNQFMAFSQNSDWISELRDLVVATFTELSSTPVYAFGINYECHFDIKSKTDEILRELGNEPGFLPSAQLTAISYKSPRDNGFVGVKVERSNLVNGGLFMQINNHFQSSVAVNDIIGCEEMIELLDSSFDECVESSERLVMRCLADGGAS